MQDEFVRLRWTPDWVPEATRQVPHLRRLIAHCHIKSIPVLYTGFAKTYAYLDRPRSGQTLANRYSELEVDQSAYFVEGQVWHELAPAPDALMIH